MADILDVVDIDELRPQVRQKYRDVAADPNGSQHVHHFHTGRAHAVRLGYALHPLSELPDEACEAFAGVGNPFFWGGPKPGEKVVDLGSGGGMDSLLAALWVGTAGRVIGVDMTPEMVERSGSIAEKMGLKNVEFREGLIEDLPVQDGWADVVISNPIFSAIERLRSTISGVMSTPITRPAVPTQSAASRESMPPPDPRSTTFSPGFGPPQKKGLPTPANASHASSGSSLSGCNAYPSRTA